MRYLLTISVFIAFSSVASSLNAQVTNENLVQFSGVILTADSLRAIPFAHILVKDKYRGTVSDYKGYFSFVARKKDTIIFSAIGFKNEEFVIPDTIQNNRYSLIQVMATDTIYLAETIIYPWPTKEQFKEAFLNLDIPDDDLEVARKNLDVEELRYRSYNMDMDGSMNYRNFVDQQVYKYYYNGQTQPITVLNPFAWAEFIKAWQEGKFKRKYKEND